MTGLFDWLLLADAALRLATPLILCAMAGLVSERAGIIDIGLEGKLLASAFAAAAAAALTGSAWAGLAAAIAVSAALGLLHGFACILHRGEQIISGVAINILASGLTVMIGIALYRQGGQTPLLERGERFGPIRLPGTDGLTAVPGIGPVWVELVSGHTLPVYLALAAVPLVWWLLWRTAFGLRLRAAGEKPEAVDSAGASVVALRFRALLIAGLLCGVAGAFLSTAHGAGFVREMSAGKGYIALAAMNMGRWRPWPVLLACLVFGLLEAAGARLQGAALPGLGTVPVELVLVLPHIATVVLLAGFLGRAVAPRALGQPSVKERWRWRRRLSTRRQRRRWCARRRRCGRTPMRPISGFAVGAAVLDADGRIHAGANVENAAYPQGQCAEASALGVMVAAGGRRGVAVAGPAGALCTPCGGCRQRLRAFAGPEAAVIVADPAGEVARFTLGALLPQSFGPETLG